MATPASPVIPGRHDLLVEFAKNKPQYLPLPAHYPLEAVLERATARRFDRRRALAEDPQVGALGADHPETTK